MPVRVRYNLIPDIYFVASELELNSQIIQALLAELNIGSFYSENGFILFRGRKIFGKVKGRLESKGRKLVVPKPKILKSELKFYYGFELLGSINGALLFGIREMSFKGLFVDLSILRAIIQLLGQKEIFISKKGNILYFESNLGWIAYHSDVSDLEPFYPRLIFQNNSKTRLFRAFIRFFTNEYEIDDLAIVYQDGGFWIGERTGFDLGRYLISGQREGSYQVLDKEKGLIIYRDEFQDDLPKYDLVAIEKFAKRAFSYPSLENVRQYLLEGDWIVTRKKYRNYFKGFDYLEAKTIEKQTVLKFKFNG